jgi:hypothetical protein
MGLTITRLSTGVFKYDDESGQPLTGGGITAYGLGEALVLNKQTSTVQYAVADVTVIDGEETPETAFADMDALAVRLGALGVPGFNGGGTAPINPDELISVDADNALTTGGDDKLYVNPTGLPDNVTIGKSLTIINEGGASGFESLDFEVKLPNENGQLLLKGNRSDSDQECRVQVSPEEGEAILYSRDNTGFITDTQVVNRMFVNPSYGSVMEMSMSGAINVDIQLQMVASESGGTVQFSDGRTITKGIEYQSDYSAGFTDRSLVDKATVAQMIADAIAAL